MNLRIASIFKERPGLLLRHLIFCLSGRPNPIHLWEDDKVFSEMMRLILDHTLVDRQRCFMLYQFCKQTDSLKGDIAEIGVFKGGTAKLLSECVRGQGRNIHLFDTFEGMPDADPRLDIVRKGDFKDTSLEGVKAFLGDVNNIHYYKGFFPQSAKPVENLTFSLVHIDVDMHRSVADCCAFFYPRMQKGGIMVFDDYGQLSCPGAKAAVDGFFADKNETPCYLPTGQSVVFRL